MIFLLKLTYSESYNIAASGNIVATETNHGYETKNNPQQVRDFPTFLKSGPRAC